MKIEYKYDEKLLIVKETANGNDIEFTISLYSKDLKPPLEEVRDYFNENKILTDVLFYTHPNHVFQIIVRKDFYKDFLLQLFKHQIIQQLKWV